MEGREVVLREKLHRLMREAAETAVELDRANGTVTGVPHYSVIELRAHELGRQLSRKIQQQHMTEVVAHHAAKAKCPTCGTCCDLEPSHREVTSIDGECKLQEWKGHCRKCRKDFFPSARDVGL
jgi:hypothetical protein